jgi:hypothetical protein
LLASADIHSPADVPDLLTLTNLQTRLLTGELGLSSIKGDAFYSPSSRDQVKLPRTDPLYPEVMRTRAWAMKTLNAQLAFWTELRHDTLLYVQQSYTVPITCGYRAGFVEPRPEFWQRMGTLANLASTAVAALPLSGTISLPGRHTNYPIRHNYNLGIIKAGQVAWLGCPGNWVCPCGPPGQRALTRNPNFSGASANERTPLSALTPT